MHNGSMRLANAVQQQLYAAGAHLIHRLRNGGQRRIQAAGKRNTVKTYHGQILRNAQSRFERGVNNANGQHI